MPSPRLIALLGVLSLTALPTPAQPVAEADYEQAITTILCDCGCHPQSVKACACGRAAEMRGQIAELVASGGEDNGPMTGDEVVALYVENYGEQILVAPSARGFNLVAWLGPLLMLLLATAGVFFMARRWSGRPQPIEAPVAAVDVPDNEGYRERLQQALKEIE